MQEHDTCFMLNIETVRGETQESKVGQRVKTSRQYEQSYIYIRAISKIVTSNTRDRVSDQERL